MRFPAERFVSLADHAAWQRRYEPVSQDRRLAETAPPPLGTCAPCLRGARFSGGFCDCADRLAPSARALLHAAVAEAGLCGWSRLRLVAVTDCVARRLAALAAQWVTVEADTAIVGVLPTDPEPALRDARRSLVRGGCLLAALAFDAGAPRCGVGRHGWDVLDVAVAVGFSRAEVLRPWSRELGYLGGEMFFLRAVV